MTRALLLAVVFIAVCALVYLIGAFIAWDLNPGSWDVIGRFAIALSAPWLGVTAVAIVISGYKP